MNTFRDYKEVTFQNKHILRIGLILSISCASITSLFNIFGSTYIQPTEIFFLSSVLFCLPLVKRFHFTILDYLILFYILIFTINFIIHRDKIVFVELVGIIYLSILYFVISRFLVHSKRSDQFIKTSLVGLVIISICSGVIGFLLYYLGGIDKYVKIFLHYPYLGDTVRLKGFTWCNLLLSAISLGLFFVHLFSYKKLVLYLIISGGIIVSLLTFSKEFVPFILLFMLMHFGLKTKYNLLYKCLPYFTILIASLMVVLTFFVIKPNYNKTNYNTFSASSNTGVVNWNAGITVSNFTLYPTTYFYLFKNSLTFFKNHPYFGIGSGRFKLELDHLKENNAYPKSFQTDDTHDLYWGQVAELGVLYLFFLGGFFFLFIRIWKNNDLIIPVQYHTPIVYTFVFFFICFLIGGSKTYRHFWIFLAIVNSFYLRKEMFFSNNKHKV